MELIEKERIIYMQKRNHYMFQKPMKVLATSTILTTTLFSPIMTNGLIVHAETIAVQTTNQYEQRDFELPGIGSFSSEAKREKRSEQKNYIPTGIYVKPNEQVTIEVSGTQKIRAIIGTHQYDKEWGKEVNLSPGSNTISSPNGGLIGFDNPQDTGTVKVKVTQGGSPVPFFELGKQTKEDWITMMNKYPDAHAVQLKSEKAVLTVTQDSAKKYIVDQDPVPLLKKYDEMIRAQDKISGLSEKDPNPLHRSTRRIWAFVENPNKRDWGMYAGWDGAVFTTAGNAIESALNVNKFGWGQMHEAGHTREIHPLTWTDLHGMVDVTTNIYSLAAQKQLFPNEPTRLEKDGVYNKAFTYLQQTDKDYKNINDLFVKLVMLWQLHLAYGEDFYPNLHKLYRELPEDQLPKTDEEKRQAFIYNSSKVAKQNLLPFFDQWGLKASQETRQKIEALNYPILTAPIWEATDSKPVKANVLKLGGRVWEDSNQNGIQDQGEKGMEGVRIQLLNKDGNGLKEVKTDKEGHYLFDGLIEDTYCVQVEKLTGYIFMPKQSGQDVTVDSNVSEAGVTDAITLLHDDLTIDAGVNRNIFKDVPQGHWAFNAIYDLANKGIIAGYGNRIFGMGDNVTREQVAALIYRTLHIEKQDKYENPYGDIDKNSTMFPEEILALTKLGIFQGDDQGNFRPKATLTRAEMAQVITKAFRLNVKAPHNFNDVPANSWAKDAISAVQSNHIAAGIGEGKFAPDMKVTREQYAQFLYNAILNERSHQ
ncbi:M60 family metallopeptidase [Bacillus mycoides]|uniref:M60 family metallopeptidase n=2 Tax=Bacillus mycoides TaxID=1405 RepID=UPI002E09DD84|nr:M60 family metallopeptidase [Bacillus mycoides]MEC5263891.1 M60 family metallopeptidase [Bacillus mycoides]